MDEHQGKPNIEDRISSLRDGIDAADATGLVADEEFIANLHTALPSGHPAHATIDKLHSEIKASAPNSESIGQHVHHLRALPELEAIVANWWDRPSTQGFIASLGQIGL